MTADLFLLPEARVELDKLGVKDITLMEGEHIESALALDSNGGQDSSGNPEVVLLTDRRIIHVRSNGRSRKTVFASVQDVDLVELKLHREISGYIWGAVAILVAIILSQVINNTVGSVAAGVIVGLMGLYLIVDQLTMSGNMVAVFRVGSSQFKLNLQSEQVSAELRAFIDRLFQLKYENGTGPSKPRSFAPR